MREFVGRNGTARRRWPGAILATLGLALGVGVSTSGQTVHAAPGDGVWQITLDKVAPDPVPTGVPSSFLLSLQCSALEAPACLNGVVTIPLPEHIRPTTDVDPNPYVVGRAIVDGALRLTLAPSFPAGGSLQVGLRLTADNFVTPNGYGPSFTATVTGANTPPASDSAAATFTATPSLGITKRLPAGAPNGTAFPLDADMTYTISACDTRGFGVTGALGMESSTVVDTLPASATFVAASNGGVYDPAAGTVTWTLGAQDTFCYPTLSVTVRYDPANNPPPSVTNGVTVTGRPLGTTSDVSASASVNHTFGNPTATGNFCKTSTSYVTTVTPACGVDVDALTYLGPWLGAGRNMEDGAARTGGRTESSFRLSIENSGVVAGTVDLVEPVPCRTSSDGQTPATYTSNAPGDICTDPAWIVTGIRNAALFPTSGFALAILAGNYPTYVTTTGETRDFTPHPIVATGAPGWLFTPQPGDVVAEIRWNGVPAPAATSGQRASIAQVYGYLPADLHLGDRVTNVASRTLTVGASVLTGTSRASLVAGDGVVANIRKSSTNTTTFTLFGGVTSPSQSPVWTSGMVFADLLPVEIPAVELSVARYSAGAQFGLVDMPASAFQLEQIPDYQGSGRTLVRVTIPPGVPVTSHPTAVNLVFRIAGGGSFPWFGSRSNSARLFVPGHDVDRCTTDAGFDGGGPPATSDDLDWDGDGVTTADNYCSGSANLTRAGTGPSVQAVKQVRGNLDTTYAGYPKVALTDPSLPGDAGYRIVVRNTGTTALRDAVLYDVLPAVGDTGVSATQAAAQRGSTFRPLLSGPVTVASDATVTWEVAYSTSANPCRPEVGDGSATWPAGCTDDWTTTAPADLSTVTALRLRQTGGLLTPGATPTGSATFTWPMSVPSGTPVGAVAWNTTALVATNDATDLALLPSEPPKVGLTVPQTDVQLTKTADVASGAIGQEVTFTVTAAHGTTITTNADGSVSYTNGGAPTTAVAPATAVVVADVLPAGLAYVPDSAIAQQGSFDPATGAWSVGTLDVGATATLTYRATITATGNHVNQAEVSAGGVQDADSTPGNCATGAEDDCAVVTVGTLTTGLTLAKQVESAPASGTFLDADQGSAERGVSSSGAPIRYRFVVANTGDTDLVDVTIVDPLIPFFCDDVFAIGTLAAGASTTVDCTLPIGFGVGTTVNTASVTATAPGGQALQATNTAQVVVPTPAIAVEKTTNGVAAATPDAAVLVAAGDTVTWTYVVRNAGDDDLVELTLGDDREAVVTLDPSRCSRTTGAWGDALAPGATITCTFTGTAQAGLYANTATASGRGVTTPILVTSTATSHYTTDPPPTSPPTTPTTPAPTKPADPATTVPPAPPAPSTSPAPSGTLPATGADPRSLVEIALAVAGLGAVLLAIRARRLRAR